MYTQTSFLALALLLAGSAMSAPFGASNTTIKATGSGSTLTASRTTMLTSVTSAPYGVSNTTIKATGTGKIFTPSQSTMLTSTTSAVHTPVVQQQSSSTSKPSSVIASSSTFTCTSTTPNPTLFQQLTLAPNAVERMALLQDSDFIFNFADTCRTAGVTSGMGGKIVRADHATFPALVAQGGSVAIGFLGPCGFNTPHVHPRAAELNLVIEGRLFASMIAENGARHLNHTLNKYEMTVFPQGSVHTEFNPDCTDAVFVASFPSEDPGVGQIAQEYFGLESEIVRGSSGGEIAVDGRDIDAFRTKIPANIAMGVDSCLAKCGLAKR
ncbi:hypothetical protein EG329_003706 [Mollisiaceae sp. DMI_Dod_QoI]|nr:hypothetical protein EG329_003706 [Helotiales sp. DMI_Dod_QoI]